MTVENVRISIEQALTPKPNEKVPRISKREAQHMVNAALQGAGPDPLLESVFLASFVAGAGSPLLLEMLEDSSVAPPDFGTPGADYLIDDQALKVFNAFFHKYAVPVGDARETFVAEMREQTLNLGKGRAKPAGNFYKVGFQDHRGDPWTGLIDAKSKVFFIEKPEAGRRGESVFYGAFKLDNRIDNPRR